MPIQEIPFNHFFVETQDKIKEYMYKTLNPYTMKFLKAEDVYFAIGVLDKDTIEIYSTVGTGIQGFREFIKSCKTNGINILRFSCSEYNKTTQAIYRYAGAKKISETKNFYSNGDTCFRYELNIKESKRLN